MKQARPNTFKIAQINAENLFLFLDQPSDRDWANLGEKEWQKLSQATVSNKSLYKTLWLAETLKDIDADIVCVNEVGGIESLHNFARYFLKDAYEAHLIEGNSDRGIDIGYLVRKGFAGTTELRTHKNRPLNFLYPHDVQSNEFHALNSPEKIIKTHYFSRDCAELRIFKAGESKPSLVILLVHLKSKLDHDNIDPEGKSRRAAEAATLMDIYREVRGEFDPPVPTIVTGDFNGHARAATRAEEFVAMNESDLSSVIELLGHEGEAAATQLIFSRQGGMHALEIDYIFISPDLKPKLVPEGSFVFRYLSDLKVTLPLPKTLEQRLTLPSDHYPVVATFKDLTF